MVFYFSGTGNSEYAARRIAAALGDEVIINIPDAAKAKRFEYTAKEGEKVGFAFPVYYWGVPYTVVEFVKKLSVKNADYVWNCATCGGHTGNANGSFKKLLSERGMELSACFGVVMVENYIPMFDIDEDIDGILDAADKEIDRFAEIVCRGEKGNFDPIRGALAGVKSAVMYPFYNLGRKTKKFYAEDGCTACGLCESVCPEDAITMENGAPKWVKDKCSMCTGCINRCPVRVLQFGSGTKKRGRYYNPRLV
ncbi:MAG: EFR1 family ferrodoxin [Oscillospiraceae bacterium]|nr:EFR1 family ferrodoxin [Oscillospiraceae bacterium]